MKKTKPFTYEDYKKYLEMQRKDRAKINRSKKKWGENESSNNTD